MRGVTHFHQPLDIRRSHPLPTRYVSADPPRGHKLREQNETQQDGHGYPDPGQPLPRPVGSLAELGVSSHLEHCLFLSRQRAENPHPRHLKDRWTPLASMARRVLDEGFCAKSPIQGGRIPDRTTPWVSKRLLGCFRRDSAHYGRGLPLVCKWIKRPRELVRLKQGDPPKVTSPRISSIRI